MPPVFETLYVDQLIKAGMPPTALTRERALAREAACGSPTGSASAATTARISSSRPKAS
jgi:ATP-dependent helicase/nuclease subunit B